MTRVERLLDFSFSLPNLDQVMGLVILGIAMAIMSFTMYKLVLRNCVRDGIHPAVLRISLWDFSTAIMIPPIQFFHLLSIGSGWIFLIGTLIGGLITLQFAVRKIVPWVGGLVLLFVAMSFVVESFGMAK